MPLTIVITTPDFDLLGPARTPHDTRTFEDDQNHKNAASAEGNGHYHDIYVLVCVGPIMQTIGC